MSQKLLKLAALLPDVKLQPHQQQLYEEAEEAAKQNKPFRKLLLWQLGSGKSLGAIAAAEALGTPYTGVVPAALRNNLRGEISKFTDAKTPADVMSYTAVGAGALPQHPQTLLADEGQRLRNMQSAQSTQFMDLADNAKNVIMMSGTPIVNRIGDFATPFNVLTGEKLTPEEFEAKYVKPRMKYKSLFHRIFGIGGKAELDIANESELKRKLKGKVSYFDPGKPTVPVSYEDVHVTMSPQQERLYQAMFKKLPWWVRRKLKSEVAMSEDELRKAIAFMTGPRQSSLSTYPYMRTPNPQLAFDQSSKLKTALTKLQDDLADPRKKALVFSNYLDAGLKPYAAGLAKANIPHGIFHGGLSDAERKKLVDEYNNNKLRVMLLGPSGAEGISTKGTSLVQLLDPSYQPVRPQQSIGRALRFDSHLHLPEELKNVKVQRFFSRLPLPWKARLLARLGIDQSAKAKAVDDRLAEISEQKRQYNDKFVRLLKSSSAVPVLLNAKRESDRKNYGAKHELLRQLLKERPEDFIVDSENKGIIGLTHKSGFRIHAPRRVLPLEFILANDQRGVPQ